MRRAKTMSATTPAWLTDLKQEIDAEHLRKELAYQSRLYAAEKLKGDGPDLYCELVRELTINAEAVAILGRGWAGSATAVHGYDKPEWEWRINIENRTPITKATWIKVCYVPGEDAITIRVRNLSTIDGLPSRLIMGLQENGSTGFSGDGIEPGSTARRTAEVLVSRMVGMLKD